MSCLNLIKAQAVLSSLQELNRISQKYDLTLQDAIVLNLVRLEIADTTTDLSRELDVSIPRMSLIIKNLEDKKMITRTAFEEDHRVMELKLTDKGSKQLEEILLGDYDKSSVLALFFDDLGDNCGD